MAAVLAPDSLCCPHKCSAARLPFDLAATPHCCSSSTHPMAIRPLNLVASPTHHGASLVRPSASSFCLCSSTTAVCRRTSCSSTGPFTCSASTADKRSSKGRHSFACAHSSLAQHPAHHPSLPVGLESVPPHRETAAAAGPGCRSLTRPARGNSLSRCQPGCVERATEWSHYPLTPSRGPGAGVGAGSGSPGGTAEWQGRKSGRGQGEECGLNTLGLLSTASAVGSLGLAASFGVTQHLSSADVAASSAPACLDGSEGCGGVNHDRFQDRVTSQFAAGGATVGCAAAGGTTATESLSVESREQMASLSQALLRRTTAATMGAAAQPFARSSLLRGPRGGLVMVVALTIGGLLTVMRSSALGLHSDNALDEAKVCSECDGYGQCACEFCEGRGSIMWEGKHIRSDPCPACVGEGCRKCSSCGGLKLKKGLPPAVRLIQGL